MLGITSSRFGLIAILPVLVLVGFQLYAPELLTELTQQWIPAGFLGKSLSHARPSTPIVMACTPHFGHMEKIAIIAEGLIQLGYPVTFVTSHEFKENIGTLGASFEPLDGPKGFLTEEDLATFMSLPSDEKEAFAITKLWVKLLPYHESTMQRVFTEFKEKYGKEKPIIYVGGSTFGGFAPQLLGVPGIIPDAFLGIGLTSLMMESNDSYPFRDGRTPDTSPESRTIHWKAQQEQHEQPFFRDMNVAWREQLRSMGATKPIPTLFEAFNVLPDILLQLNIPEFDYPRSDIDHKQDVRYIGPLPAVGIGARDLPPWWDEVLAAEQAGKKIVSVTSRSADNDPEDLIMPTMRALQGREDVLVVATLVAQDPDSELALPSNARVAKYIPYDLLLPHVSVMVASGGWGTVQQAIRLGVPIVLAGVAQDKVHTGALAAWAGIAVNLAVRRPEDENIRNAVKEILENASYKDRVMTLAAKAGQYDPIAEVDKTIQEVLKKGVRRKEGR